MPKKTIFVITILIVLGFIFFFKNNENQVFEPVEFNPQPVPEKEVGKYPNILLVIADDFGKDADPCHREIGSEKPYMPNLEKMCESGIVFDNLWTNPVCSPTRTTMITGKYAFRAGVTDVNDILDPDEQTIADVLTNNVPVPYYNAFIGKWHLSGSSTEADPTSPWGYGVQHFFGFLGGGIRDYFQHQLVKEGQTVRSGGKYATTAFTDDAIDWLAKQKKKEDARPWFLWLAYNSPHAPFHLPPKELTTNKFLSGDEKDIEENPRDYYFAALEALDSELGRLLDSIPEDELSNTVIIFVGDNGTPSEVIQSPYAAASAKGSLYQGGIWGSLVVSGFGVERFGAHEDALINSSDIFATISELAGSRTSPPEDGVSFVGALTDKNFKGREYIFAEYERGFSAYQKAIRDNRYKLIIRGNTEELYDLLKDPYESNNLIDEESLAPIISKLQSLERWLD